MFVIFLHLNNREFSKIVKKFISLLKQMPSWIGFIYLNDSALKTFRDKKGTGLRHLTLFYKIRRSDFSLGKFMNPDLRLLLTHKTAEGNFRLFKFHTNFRGHSNAEGKLQTRIKIVTKQGLSLLSKESSQCSFINNLVMLVYALLFASLLCVRQ